MQCRVPISIGRKGIRLKILGKGFRLTANMGAIPLPLPVKSTPWGGVNPSISEISHFSIDKKFRLGWPKADLTTVFQKIKNLQNPYRQDNPKS